MQMKYMNNISNAWISCIWTEEKGMNTTLAAEKLKPEKNIDGLMILQ